MKGAVHPQRPGAGRPHAPSLLSASELPPAFPVLSRTSAVPAASRHAVVPAGGALSSTALHADVLHAEAADPALRRLGLHFAGLAAVTYALVVLGALVRANHAGLACPDWPLCFGEFVPEIDVQVGFEFGHRVLAGLVSLGFLGGAIAAFRNPTARARVGTWVIVAGVVLAVQIVLGGLTVLELLASWTVTSHLITGNAFALSVAVIAHRLLRDAAAPRTAGALRAVATATGGVLVLQIALGGLVSSTYSGLVCPDWPACDGQAWFPTFRGPVGLQILHRLNAYLLIFGIAASLWLAHASGAVAARRMLAIAMGLGLAQIVVGVANVLLRLPVEVTGTHSALAAGLCLVLGLTLHDLWRPGPFARS